MRLKKIIGDDKTNEEERKILLEERNKGLIVFGIVLLVIGLVASFYQEQVVRQPIYYVNGKPITTPVTPFQSIGILPDVAGIVLVVLGLLYPSHRTLPPPTNPQQQKTN